MLIDNCYLDAPSNPAKRCYIWRNINKKQGYMEKIWNK